MKVAQKGWADPEPLCCALWDFGSSAHSHDTRKTVAKIRHASYHDALLAGAEL